MNEVVHYHLNTFPENITFKYPWRNYQKRVLDELSKHLTDEHLHVIAPPGSGKTVLGLQVMLEINQSTLILTPTIAIRNQWIQRFCNLFLQTSTAPNWISNNIKEPQFLTVSTYHALHALCAKEDETDEGIVDEDNFKDLNFGTIILDEAHHLKNAWWQTLMALKTKLQPKVVGLTATPPYDVSFTEWERYIQLNGPIDTEISVPELVKEQNLCPHQDYIHFSYPTQSELSFIYHQRESIKMITDKIASDAFLVDYLLSHPAIENPEQHLDWIYDQIEIYSAILIYLSGNQQELTDFHFKITGNKQRKIPPLDKHWLEVLFNYLIFEEKKSNKEFSKHIQTVEKFIRMHGGIVGRKVVLENDQEITQYLKNSTGKIESILSIAQFEHNNLGERLRMVVLSDYIRKEYLNEEIEINKLGVVPIFEHLRRNLNSTAKLCVLTGSLIILPEAMMPVLTEVLHHRGLQLSTTSLPYDTAYVVIHLSEKLKHEIVEVVTQLFEEGHFNIVVGTKALLGEGWDAPCINSLILASVVGSYVLSNQMRGRAIRTSQSDRNKTSNIWHLVSVDPTRSDGGEDLKVLKRRFRAFVGISEREQKTIENGILRMEIPYQFTEETAQLLNKRMFQSAGERDQLSLQWNEAIQNGVEITEEIKVPFDREEKNFHRQKKLYYRASMGYLLLELGQLFMLHLMDFYEIAEGFLYAEDRNELLMILCLADIGGLFYFGKKLLKTIKIYSKYRDVTKDLQQIGDALLRSLIQTKIFYSKPEELSVKTFVNDYGEAFCYLEGGSSFEKNTFVNALEEIINPIQNPRYIVERVHQLWAFFTQKDYHAVPEQLGKKKKTATIFHKYWNKYFNESELYFTRNIEGRKRLLKFRFNSLSSELSEKAERVSRWK
ncbi:DEAD/DEAH box helicase family protein [Flammeovirga sp. EKP202]|uniref:DEAD/DEAH box helicase family protein n=1 Tax=Flammeovirga sp. EKP202 TaxID=2770592 RepID=UPI00165F906F|nr:DEAD/DEAH box helicase family protein [Flammeovirga sp. EKP202]MBD0402545.1 DEAD/DEAH box helicase family protein [Flammeovirga sp. EKP202]